jgi:hypothetical protein
VICYEVQNGKAEIVAVLIKFDDGTCLLKYARTKFDSVEEAGQHMTADLTLHEVPKTYYERST